MNSKWTLNEHSEGVLEVVVDGEAWENAQKKAFNDFKKNVSIKGFRTGKVPEALLKKQISKEAIYDRAVEGVANEALVEAVKEHNLELVARPTLDYKDASDESVTLVINCVVSPEVTLGEYKGLDIHKDEVNVTDEDVEAELSKVQDRFADWVLREEGQPAEDGDQVTIDFVGKKDGEPFEGGSGENYPLELGSNTFIPGFEEQLVGVKTDDVKDVTVTFPEDYQAADLAGKEAVFTVTVHDIKYKDRPEVNDELIAQLKRDGVETVEKFKEVTKEDLTKERERAADEKFTNDLMETISDNATVEIPAVMIENEVDNLYRDFTNRMQQSGFTAEQYFAATGQTEADLKATMRPDAQRRVKGSLVLDAVIKAENIEISDEDVEKEYTEMSTLYNMDVEQIKKLLPAENIKDDLAQQKALELIKSSVK
ncbi:trigger factor [Firmicutes bacterium AM41-11]|nr:trigger factor [Firmicutes bacterium AM41-11]